MKIGVYVGSFNPPHLGHQKIIEHLLKNGYVDKIEIIATGNYWDKNNLIEIQDRVNMLKSYEAENIIINNELNHLPYTYQVLNQIKEKYKTDELILVIGDDNLPKFHLWKNYKKILNNQVIVLKRNEINIEDTIAYKFNPRKFIIVKDFPIFDISSTRIREYLKKESYKDASVYLNESVLAYIIDHNLYRDNM